MMALRHAIQRFAQAFLALALLLAPAAADQPVLAKIRAHPAIWTVHGEKGTAYLFGALHLMPANIDWHTPQIDAALAKADIFVFEIALGDETQARLQEFIAKNGTLPPDQSLPALLTDDMRADYRKVLDQTHTNPNLLVNKRPWFAALVLSVASMVSQNYSPQSGTDQQVLSIAKAKGKELRYFETIDEQMNLLMPQDPKLELDEFASSLKEILKAKKTAGGLLDAWSRGDANSLNRQMNAEIGQSKEAEKVMFTDRNAKWVAKLQKMLREPKTFFITVGAGHLAGPHSVPAMLRAKGYKVEGP